MPQTVTTVDILQEYLIGVISRAEHHANNVNEICLAIAGAVVWRKEGDIQVLAREGDMKNVLWFWVGGERFALSYDRDHEGGPAIVVRDSNTQGRELAAFTNASSIADVKQFFGNL